VEFIISFTFKIIDDILLSNSETVTTLSESEPLLSTPTTSAIEPIPVSNASTADLSTFCIQPSSVFPSIK
jgi:hypothetical protein